MNRIVTGMLFTISICIAILAGVLASGGGDDRELPLAWAAATFMLFWAGYILVDMVTDHCESQFQKKMKSLMFSEPKPAKGEGDDFF